MSLLEREEEKQSNYSSAAVSGVLPEYSVHNLPPGYGGLHQCSHIEGSYYIIIITHSESRNEISERIKLFYVDLEDNKCLVSK